jgi:hypothetical protein
VDQALDDAIAGVYAEVRREQTTLPFQEGNPIFKFSDALNEASHTLREGGDAAHAQMTERAAKVYRYGSSIADKVQTKAADVMTATLNGAVATLRQHLQDEDCPTHCITLALEALKAMHRNGVVAGAAVMEMERKGILSGLDRYN